MSDHQDRVAAALGTFMQRHRRGVPNAAPTRRKGKTPEGTLLAAVLDALNALPDVWALRVTRGVLPDPARPGRKITFGLADGAFDVLTLVGPHGTAVWLECKAAGKDLRDNQRWFQGRARGVGCVAEPVWSVADAVAIVARVRATRNARFGKE